MKLLPISIFTLAASTLLTASASVILPTNLFSGGPLTPPAIAATTPTPPKSPQNAHKLLAQAVSNAPEKESVPTLNLDSQASQGSFSNPENKFPDGSLFNLYQFDAQAGQTINIEVSGNKVHPSVVLLQVTQSEDGETELVPVAIGEMNGESPTRLITTLETSGTYVVLVSDASENGAGSYTIKASATL
jgi:hypothetical protein